MKKIFNTPTKTITLLWIHPVIVLAISYFIALGFISSTKLLSFFSVLDESGDVPMSDMYFKINSRRETARLDTNITLVNIDLCKDRFEIAQLIEQVESLQPKVIGLDAFFRNRKEQKADSVLENEIRRCKNLVISCILDIEHSNDNDKYFACYRNFFAGQKDDNFTEGFLNFDSDGNSPVQTFTPKLFLQEGESLDTLYCFAAQIAKLYNEIAFQKLLQRVGNLEIINFQPLRFYEIDKNEIRDSKEQITGKIVLIGSLSEDMHKTPINPRMLGMEIHAHVISTIIEEKYIDRFDNIWSKLLNILLCYIFTLFCWLATTKLKAGVAILIKLVQVAILLLAFFIGYFLFNHYHIDVTYTRSVVVIGVVILIVDIYHVCISLGSKLIFKRNKTDKNEKDT